MSEKTTVEERAVLRTPLIYPSRCRVKKGWDQEGRTGILLCIVDVKGYQDWGVVMWDDAEDEPELSKMAALEEVKNK